MKKAVNAIILDENKEKVLLIKRKEGIHSGKWAFPGGIVEENEAEESALRREVKEETGLEISSILKKIGEYEYSREDNEQTKGESFLVSIKNQKTKIKFNKSEISDFKWATAEEIDLLDCAPGIQEEAMKALYCDG